MSSTYDPPELSPEAEEVARLEELNELRGLMVMFWNEHAKLRWDHPSPRTRYILKEPCGCVNCARARKVMGMKPGRLDAAVLATEPLFEHPGG